MDTLVRQVAKAGKAGLSVRQVEGLTAAQVRTAREEALRRGLITVLRERIGSNVRYVISKKPSP